MKCKTVSVLLAVLLVCIPAVAAKQAPKTTAKPGIAYVQVPQETYEQVLNELREKSDDAWHSGEFETVAFCLKIITELDPGDIVAWSDRAWVYWSALQKDDEAFKVLRMGIKANPKNPDLYYETAILHDHRKEYAKAAEFFSKALTLGADPITRHALAHALERSSQIEKAKKVWKDALKADPKDEAARNNLQRIEKGDIWKPDAKQGEQETRQDAK